MSPSLWQSPEIWTPGPGRVTRGRCGLAGAVYNISVSSLTSQLLLKQDSMRSLLIFLGKYSCIHCQILTRLRSLIS